MRVLRLYVKRYLMRAMLLSEKIRMSACTCQLHLNVSNARVGANQARCADRENHANPRAGHGHDIPMVGRLAVPRV